MTKSSEVQKTLNIWRPLQANFRLNELLGFFVSFDASNCGKTSNFDVAYKSVDVIWFSSANATYMLHGFMQPSNGKFNGTFNVIHQEEFNVIIAIEFLIVDMSSSYFIIQIIENIAISKSSVSRTRNILFSITNYNILLKNERF